MVFGAGLIIVSFIIFKNLTIQVAHDKSLDKLSKQLFSAAIGTGNGIFIFILTLIYDTLAKKICNWENHKYESDYMNSMIIKSFVFNFVVSYINLFYYAFFYHAKNKKSQFGVLGTNFVSIVLSKNLAFIFTTNIIPYLKFVWKKWRFEKEWKVHKKVKKEKFVS